MDKFEKQSWLDTYRLLNPDKIDIAGGPSAPVPARNIGWRIDYFYRRQAQKWLKNAYILTNILGSDHCPIGIEIKYKIAL